MSEDSFIAAEHGLELVKYEDVDGESIINTYPIVGWRLQDSLAFPVTYNPRKLNTTNKSFAVKKADGSVYDGDHFFGNLDYWFAAMDKKHAGGEDE